MQRSSMAAGRISSHTTRAAGALGARAALPRVAHMSRRIGVRPAAAEDAASTSTSDSSKPATSVSLWDVMKFSGPAPERVNGRLAMLAFALAATNEARGGDTAVAQFLHAPWWQYALFAVFIYASIVPMMKGVRLESFGWLSPRAETTNGRAAMLGFGILLALELKSHVPFF